MKRSERRTILDRANRMLRQSRTLRKLSDELLEESNDLRSTVTGGKSKQSARRRRK